MEPNPLDSIETPYVDAQTLLSLLQAYKKPWDWIARQVKTGKLIRVKNGLYCIAKRELLKPQLANILYGPSYLSLQWALSFYGLIPERAATLTSVTTRRNKEYRTPVGTFTYSYLNQDRYCVSFKITDDHFLIATPEKAVIDFIHFFCEADTQEDLLNELFESYRMSAEDLKNLDRSLLNEIASQYRSPMIHRFIKSLELL